MGKYGEILACSVFWGHLPQARPYTQHSGHRRAPACQGPSPWSGTQALRGQRGSLCQGAGRRAPEEGRAWGGQPARPEGQGGPLLSPELVWKPPKPVRLQRRNTLLCILCLSTRDQLRVNPSQRARRLHLKLNGRTSRVICLCISHSVVPDSLQPRGLEPARLLCPWGFPSQEYWSRLPSPSPGDLPNPGIEPRPPALQADSLPLTH